MRQARPAVPFVKGHGTGNDFVVLPDPDGELDLTPSRVRTICDRRRGLGADGVLRVLPGGLVPDAPPGTVPGDWFLDYRNADGSVAEMCGNGVRVFVRYLTEVGLVRDTEFRIGSRSGPRMVWLTPDSLVGVAMGPVRRRGTSTVTLGAAVFAGLVVDVGNPHLACVTSIPVQELDLRGPPGYDSEVFPRGVNVEFVNVCGDDVCGDDPAVPRLRLRMRVHERGVGETLSCGTGTVAAVAGALAAQGRSVGTAEVTVPGGQLVVTVDAEDSTLSGPAVLVAHGQFDPEWWLASE